MMHDPDLHLLVDDHEIQHYARLLRVLNRPRKHPEPVLVADRPWEEACPPEAWGSVIQEPDGLLRMWYFAFRAWNDPGTEENGGFCYAESRDGIHWEKPDLGLVSWKGGWSNNFFLTFSPDGRNVDHNELARRGQGLTARDEQGREIGILTSMDGMTVLRDDEDPDPTRRYKLVALMFDTRMWAPYFKNLLPNVTEEQVQAARQSYGHYLLTSPDGIHWSQEPQLVRRRPNLDYVLVTRDERHRRWWINERPKALRGRNVGLSVSEGFADWGEPEAIFTNGPEAGYGELWEWHGGITPFNYGNMDLGLLEKWSNAGLGDTCELVSHRDGQRWQRVMPGAPFLDIGPEGAFDRYLIYPTHNPPIRRGDKLLIYYTGQGVDSRTGRGGSTAIGLATIGLDRFAGLAHSKREPGTVVTKPLAVSKPQLELNVEPADIEPQLFRPDVRVAIKNPDWSEIPGYTLEDCAPIERDGVRQRVQWQGKAGLQELSGRTVTLHFSVTRAVLYSFRFADET